MFLVSDAFNMIRDIGRSSQTVNVWGALLNIVQLLGSLIFIAKLEAQVILVVLIFTLIVAGQIHKKARFSRLVGLCHLPWLVMLPWLVYRLQTVEHSIWFNSWGYYVAIVVAISLVFDAMDVYRYSRGDKTFSWGS